jgi:hypothetical protein
MSVSLFIGTFAWLGAILLGTRAIVVGIVVFLQVSNDGVEPFMRKKGF